MTGYGLLIGRNTGRRSAASTPSPFAFTGRLETVTIDMEPMKKTMNAPGKDRRVDWD